jgi:hypothetical protein
LFSCSKEYKYASDPPPASNPPPVGSLSFSINGATFNWKEERDTASSHYLNMAIYPDWSGYTLNASPLNQIQHVLNLPIQTTTLGVNTPFIFINNSNTPNLAVSVVTDTTRYIDPSVNYKAYPGDRVTITITKIQDNRANGTFSADLTRASDSSKVVITAGLFENIRITE